MVAKEIYDLIEQGELGPEEGNTDWIDNEMQNHSKQGCIHGYQSCVRAGGLGWG